MTEPGKKLKVLMISSSGGHWVQMNRLYPVFAGEDVYFACTEKTYAQTNPNHPFFYVPEASRTSSPWVILRQAWVVFTIVLKVRPNIVITTGAATGFFALLFGKKLGAKTIWLDSIANVDSLSMSGAKAKKYADLYMTQWEHLASEGGPLYYGALI